MLLRKKPLHWPTLNTVIMVEEAIKKLDEPFSVPALKKELPRQVNHNTLMLILQYLETSNKIAVAMGGITWIHNTNPNLRKAIKKGIRI